jgi:hypothetical protein
MKRPPSQKDGNGILLKLHPTCRFSPHNPRRGGLVIFCHVLVYTRSAKVFTGYFPVLFPMAGCSIFRADNITNYNHV